MDGFKRDSYRWNKDPSLGLISPSPSTPQRITTILGTQIGRLEHCSSSIKREGAESQRN